MRHRFAAPLVAAAALLGCSDPELPDIPGPGKPVTETFASPNLVAPEGAPVALVIDSGFDVASPAVAGRVLAAYTMVCDERPPSRPLEEFSFEELKKSWIDGYQKKDESCRLEPGTRLVRSQWLDTLEPYREEWNEHVLEGTLHELPEAYVERYWDVLYGDDIFDYHGTYVLGVAAAVAPEARFVVVQREYAPEAVRDRCPTPQAIALETRLLGDPDVMAAYANRPVSRLTEELDAVDKKFHVQYANFSFGPLTRERREKDCPSVAWAPYYEAVSRFEANADELRFPRFFAADEVLYFVAAGNDGKRIDSGKDHFDCAPRSPTTDTSLRIGAYGPNGTSAFSNYGECVDAYAPGEEVQSFAPKGYRVPFGGTSAATPFATGLAMRTLGVRGDVRARRAAFVGMLGGNRYVPTSTLPRELFYPGTWNVEERVTLSHGVGLRLHVVQ